jgi:hypothetical protein
VTVGSENDELAFANVATGTDAKLDNISVRQLNSDHELIECIYDSEGNAKTLTLGDGEVEYLGVELVTNGTFDTDTDWTKQAGWTISGGEAVATSTSGAIFQAVVSEIGDKFLVEYDVVVTAGTFRTSIRGSQSITRGVSGHYADIIDTSGGTSDSTFYLYQGATFTGTVDNVSVRKVNTDDDSNFNNQVLIGPDGVVTYSERQTDAKATKTLTILGN